MKTRALRPLLNALADFYRIPDYKHLENGAVLEGLVITESSGINEARRYEPHQDRAGRADSAQDPDRPGIDDGATEDDASYGLMQVMGYNLRKIVGAPARTQLNFAVVFYKPVFALAAGCEVLRWELDAVAREVPGIKAEEQLERALARYNGGPSGDDDVDPKPGRQMRLDAYVKKVLKNAALAAADRERCE